MLTISSKSLIYRIGCANIFTSRTPVTLCQLLTDFLVGCLLWLMILWLVSSTMLGGYVMAVDVKPFGNNFISFSIVVGIISIAIILLFAVVIIVMVVTGFTITHLESLYSKYRRKPRSRSKRLEMVSEMYNGFKDKYCLTIRIVDPEPPKPGDQCL